MISTLSILYLMACHIALHNHSCSHGLMQFLAVAVHTYTYTYTHLLDTNMGVAATSSYTLHQAQGSLVCHEEIYLTVSSNFAACVIRLMLFL